MTGDKLRACSYILIKYSAHIRIPQISPQNIGATTKFRAPEDWHKASPILRTHNSGATCELHRYPALCAWWMRNVAHFDTRGVSCNNCTENFWCHHAKFSHLSDRVPGICATLIYIAVFIYVPGRTMFLFAIKFKRRFQITYIKFPD
jgi:hypothetical protein